MKRMAAINQARAAGCGTCKLQRSLNCLGSGIRKEHLLEVGHVTQQTFRHDAGQNRDVHLDQIREVAVENFFEGIANGGMIAPDRKYAPAAQQIKVTLAVFVVKVLRLRPLISSVKSDRLQNPNHLCVEISAVQ